MISSCMYGEAHAGNYRAVRSQIGKTVGWLCQGHFEQHNLEMTNRGYHFRTREELVARGELNGEQDGGAAAPEGMDPRGAEEQQQPEYGNPSGDQTSAQPPSERDTPRDTGGRSHGGLQNGRDSDRGQDAATLQARPAQEIMEARANREASGQGGLPSRTAGPQAVIVPEWPKWAEGAGWLSLTKEQAEFLQQPFNDDELTIRYDGVVYAPWRRYWSRMVGAFKPLVPSVIPIDNPRFQGSEIVIGVVMVCGGKFIGKAWGSHRLEGENDKMSVGDRIESAISDAITKIGKRLNMGEDLWDDSFRDYWKSQYAESYERKGRTYWRRRPIVKVEEHE